MEKTKELTLDQVLEVCFVISLQEIILRDGVPRAIHSDQIPDYVKEFVGQCVTTFIHIQSVLASDARQL